LQLEPTRGGTWDEAVLVEARLVLKNTHIVWERIPLQTKRAVETRQAKLKLLKLWVRRNPVGYGKSYRTGWAKWMATTIDFNTPAKPNKSVKKGKQGDKVKKSSKHKQGSNVDVGTVVISGAPLTIAAPANSAPANSALIPPGTPANSALARVVVSHPSPLTPPYAQGFQQVQHEDTRARLMEQFSEAFHNAAEKQRELERKERDKREAERDKREAERDKRDAEYRKTLVKAHRESAARAHQLSLATLQARQGAPAAAAPAPGAPAPMVEPPDFVQWLCDVLKFEDENALATLEQQGIGEVETLLSVPDTFLKVSSYHYGN
jgi:hypothetical protein